MIALVYGHKTPRTEKRDKKRRKRGERKKRRGAVKGEKHPPKQDKTKSQRAQEPGGDLFMPSGREAFFQNQQEEKPDSPKEEMERRAMPEPGQRPHNKKIQISPRPAAPVSAQRNIKIFFKKGRERDMPAPPEFRNDL